MGKRKADDAGAALLRYQQIEQETASTPQAVATDSLSGSLIQALTR